jgi:Phosphotransferase enzyme family
MIKQQLPHTLNEESTEEEDEEFSAIISSISPLDLRDLALTTRRKLYNDLLPETSCVVSTSPRTGSFNIVYELSFSDGIKWAIRIPATGVFSPSRSRSFYLDIVTQQFISSKTSVPIPRIHDWSLDPNNILSYPYIIMDFIPGTILAKLWNDRNWITDVKRERIFDQIAEWMTELATLEFDQIDRLDWDSTSGMHRIVPFPDQSALISMVDDQGTDAPIPAGPFDTANSFLFFLLSIRRQTSDMPMLAVLQLFLSALIDSTLDGPPFVLSHPDFDSQNVLVDDDGTITGIIDWDSVDVRSRQGAAAAYPMWLTVDWDPLFYGWDKDSSPEDNARYDSPAELANYRRAYLNAITRASRGKLTHITQNSHIWTTLYIAVSNRMATWQIVDLLLKFVFGSRVLAYEVRKGIEGGAWYALGRTPGTIAEITAMLQ